MPHTSYKDRNIIFSRTRTVVFKLVLGHDACADTTRSDYSAEEKRFSGFMTLDSDLS